MTSKTIAEIFRKGNESKRDQSSLPKISTTKQVEKQILAPKNITNQVETKHQILAPKNSNIVEHSFIQKTLSASLRAMMSGPQEPTDYTSSTIPQKFCSDTSTEIVRDDEPNPIETRDDEPPRSSATKSGESGVVNKGQSSLAGDCPTPSPFREPLHETPTSRFSRRRP